MKQTYETGLWGEDKAESYLVGEKGMVCLEHRYRTKAGEIDLILLDGDCVVFVEVKTRRSGVPGSGMAAVNIAKQKRIANAALLYLVKMKWTERPARFDVIEIYGDDILHIPDAFQPYGNYFH